jgi:uncharacterized cupin superfamily protein
MAITRKWRSFALLLSASTVTIGMVLTVQLLSARPAYLQYKTTLAQAVSLPMKPSRIPASWVTSGSPQFRSTLFGAAHDGSSHSGLWECVGPGEFTWHYDEDEAIYIIEGGAEIEYLGHKFTVHPGDSTRFAAGTTAKWTVHDHIKKTWTLYEPGSLVRIMRRLFS